MSNRRPTAEQLEAFAASLEERRLAPRAYEGLEDLYNACGVIWRHMTKLDRSSLGAWRMSPVCSLANAWAEGNACVEPGVGMVPGNCRGNRTFDGELFEITRGGDK